MGSGPVIIQDDGGPPIMLEVTSSDGATPRDTVSRTGKGMRVGRANEFMPQLQVANGAHNLDDNSSQILGVAVNGTPHSPGAAINKVVVTGSGAAHVTVIAGAGLLKVRTDQPLKDVSKPGWGVYLAEKDDHIAAVSINGGANVLNGTETYVKVEIDVA